MAPKRILGAVMYIMMILLVNVLNLVIPYLHSLTTYLCHLSEKGAGGRHGYLGTYLPTHFWLDPVRSIKVPYLRYLK